MGYVRRAFEHYDPFTDQRIDPKLHKDLDQHPDLPGRIHDAVSRAKRITGPLAINELQELAKTLDNWIENAGIHQVKKLKASNRDYVWGGYSDRLITYLEANSDAVPVERWPYYLGGLALTMAGCIVNALWHDDSVETAGDVMLEYWREHPSQHPAEKNPGYALDYAFEAVNVVGYAEGLSSRVFIERHKDGSAKGGKRSNQAQEPAKEAYVAFLKSLPPDHPYPTQIAAERAFLAQLKEAYPDVYRYVASANSYKTLRAHAKSEFAKQGLPYPFD
ncbi:MAG: hypothetical protein AAGG55_03420 [Pseudomonadota bacterium]